MPYNFVTLMRLYLSFLSTLDVRLPTCYFCTCMHLCKLMPVL